MKTQFSYFILGLGAGFLFFYLFSKPRLHGLAAKAKKKESDFDSVQLEVGSQIEMEHTDNKEVAKVIAMDHLTEDPKYYMRLKSVEATASKPD